MSTLQACLLGTRADNTPIQNNPSSRFGLVFHNEDTDDTVINFNLHKVNFKTEVYEETKAPKANNILQSAHYDGNRNFTLKHYYNLVAK